MRKVGLSRYSKVSRTAFGLQGKQRIAVLRCGGAILGERGGCLADALHCWLPAWSIKGEGFLSLQSTQTSGRHLFTLAEVALWHQKQQL